MYTERSGAALPMDPIPDPAHLLKNILCANQLAAKTKIALLLALEGETYRAAAEWAGMKDHMQVFLASKRLGLSDLHLQRRLELQRRRELEFQRRVLSSGRPSLRQLARML